MKEKWGILLQVQNTIDSLSGATSCVEWTEGTENACL